MLRDKRDIPNQAGFKLIAVLHDGSQIATQVVKVRGCHKLEGVHISNVRGWLPA